jgi:hypothetical protein
MPPVEPARRVNTHETASHIVQSAVRNDGGIERIVGLISAGFEGDSHARRSLQDGRARALSELAIVNSSEPESDRATKLRATVQRASRDLVEVNREIEGAARRLAHTLIMDSMGGNPDSIRRLVDHAAKVSPAFHTAILEANQ